MAFDREPTKSPARIARVTIHIAVLKSAAAAVTYDNGAAEVVVILDDGSSQTKAVGDLNAHLTAAQRTSVKNFMDAMLLKAETEIL